MNPHDNTALYNAYSDDHPYCEVADRLGITFRLERGKWRIVALCLTPNIAGTEVHHLWSMRERPDYRSNLIKLCKPTHDWATANPTAGRVVCCLAKVRKRLATGYPREFDLAEMRVASGKWMDGWAESLEKFDDPVLEAYRYELMQRLAEIAAERGAA